MTLFTLRSRILHDKMRSACWIIGRERKSAKTIIKVSPSMFFSLTERLASKLLAWLTRGTELQPQRYSFTSVVAQTLLRILVGWETKRSSRSRWNVSHFNIYKQDFRINKALKLTLVSANLSSMLSRLHQSRPKLIRVCVVWTGPVNGAAESGKGYYCLGTGNVSL